MLFRLRQKMIELQAVLPGEVVPVLTRGVITLSAKALDGTAPAIGGDLFAAAGGQVASSGTVKVGKLIASGNREAGGTPDQFAGSTDADYLVVKVEL